MKKARNEKYLKEIAKQGKHVYMIMEALDLDPKGLSEKLLIKPSTLSLIMSGKSALSYPVAMELAIMGVSMNFIYTGVGNMFLDNRNVKIYTPIGGYTELKKVSTQLSEMQSKINAIVQNTSKSGRK